TGRSAVFILWQSRQKVCRSGEIENGSLLEAGDGSTLLPASSKKS
ncbi:MAG: hypothetical protein ACI8TQ_002874, partial [Planctomycetota bacterium]